MTAMGVDGCKSGWIAVCLGDDGVKALAAPRLIRLTEQIPSVVGVGIDIPIGLPRDAVPREADLTARRFVAARRSSVFPTPLRVALEAETYEAACEVALQETGKKLSKQSYALRDKILEAERFVHVADTPVWEVHPEVSFAVMLGHPAEHYKKTAAGILERLAALKAQGIDLTCIDGDVGSVAIDDVIDAAAAAWSTQRAVAGTARSFPADPPADPTTGRPVAIWA